MPEGVEVKLSAEYIKPLIINHRILSAAVTNNSRYASTTPEKFDEFIKNITSIETNIHGGVNVSNIQTKGKFMYWTFSNNWYMFCTFGMSGQWSSVRGKHPCLFFTHSTGTINTLHELVFNDPRHFGTIKFTNNRQDLLEKLNQLGWDPLQDQYSIYQKWIKSAIQKSSKPIAQLLMDQSIFAGVGNYIRAEALYLSKISPWRLGKLLSEVDIDTLCKSIILVMEESYQYQGATIQTYKTAYGEEGRYSSKFKVYGQKTDPFGNIIIKENTPDKRTIHWCPTIQI